MSSARENAAVTSRPHYDRLFMGSPLRRRGVCVVACAGLLVLLVFVTLVHFGVFASMRPDVMRVFVKALVLSSLLALVPLAILWFLDRRERETTWLFAAAFLRGGFIATAIALPFNTAYFRLVDLWVMQNPQIIEILGPDATKMLAAPISAPIVEETAKAAGVLVLFWLLRAEFDNMRDGIVYGALIGVGFNWYETALYVAQGYAESGMPPYAVHLGVRYALFGLGGHALFTAIFGAFLGLAIQTRRSWLRVLAPLTGLGLAVAAHMFNNALPLFAAIAAAAAGEPPRSEEELADIGFIEAFLSGTLMQLTVFLPFVVIIGIALWRSGVWERRVIREELADEIGRAVTADEYQAILNDGILRTRRIDRMRPEQSAALVNAQHELAFRKRRAREAARDPNSDALAAGWREQIRRLRGPRLAAVS
jgi:RsiW-degrading membrane proteinase PrsW (M82 family)